MLSLILSALLVTTPACGISLMPDTTRGVTYHASLIVAPSCPTTTEFRVRKSSTLNTRRAGAPYQPIKPGVGAWTISRKTSTIPANELYTLFSWRWEVFNPDLWDSHAGAFGAWQPIRVRQP